jgi:serine O-acetyltransferase
MKKEDLLLPFPEIQLKNLLFTQLKNLFLLDVQEEAPLIEKCLPQSLDRLTYCFSFSLNKYYRRNGSIFFNPLHAAQYGIFLYYLSNTIWHEYGSILLCDKLYLLSKMINSLDLFYEVEMPDVFFTDHPVGSVIGRAQYGRFFSFVQNCTVGNNNGIYPVIGDYVSLKMGASVLGRSNIGNRVIIGSGATVKDQDIPDCSLVFGNSPNLIIKSRPSTYFDLK